MTRVEMFTNLIIDAVKRYSPETDVVVSKIGDYVNRMNIHNQGLSGQLMAQPDKCYFQCDKLYIGFNITQNKIEDFGKFWCRLPHFKKLFYAPEGMYSLKPSARVYESVLSIIKVQQEEYGLEVIINEDDKSIEYTFGGLVFWITFKVDYVSFMNIGGFDVKCSISILHKDDLKDALFPPALVREHKLNQLI
jgi:hypothetical protein